MSNKFKTIAIIGVVLWLTSCSTTVTTNEILPKEQSKTEEVTESHEITHDENELANADLRDKIIGSWSTNAHPGQIDLNEDGTYKNCIFLNTTSEKETDDCYSGNWSIEESKLIVINEFGDSSASNVHWVFDNVIYLGHDSEEVK